MDLKKFLLNEIELNKKGLANELAELAGYTGNNRGSNFIRVLRNENKEFNSFQGLLNLIRYYFPNNEKEVLVDFSKTLSPKRKLLRYMLEYTTLERMNDVKQEIIERLMSSGNDESREWGHIYNIDWKVQKGILSYTDAMKEIYKLECSSIEMKIYSKIIHFYINYQFRNLDPNMVDFDRLAEDVEEIPDDYIRNSFRSRLSLLKFDLAMHSSAVTDKVVQDVLEFVKTDVSNAIKSLAYLQLGNYFMLESFDKAYGYFKKALDVSDDVTKLEINQSISFFSLVWERLEYFVLDNTKSNMFFYYIRKGNYSEARRIELSIDFDNYNDHQKAFHMYYKGIMDDNIDYFYESIEYFNKCHEKHYKKLPILELQKRGERESILKALSV